MARINDPGIITTITMNRIRRIPFFWYNNIVRKKGIIFTHNITTGCGCFILGNHGSYHNNTIFPSIYFPTGTIPYRCIPGIVIEHRYRWSGR